MLISLTIACTLNIITYMKRLSYSKIKYMREWRKKQLRINPVKYKLQAMVRRAKVRAKKKDIPFTLDWEQLIPLAKDKCPYFTEIKLDWGNKEKGIIEFYEWLPDNYEVLFMELRIFDKLSYKAGTIDGVLYNKDTGKLVLIDWKTNNKNLLEYYKSKKLKYDFNGLYATDLNKYSIQLSDYKYMIEKCTDFEVEEMWIIWLTNFNINELTMGRSGDYNIDNVEPFMDTSNYKIFKLEDYSNIISYHVEKDLKYIKSKSKKTKFKFRNTEKVTFTKKKSKNKSLTSKIKKAKNNENK